MVVILIILVMTEAYTMLSRVNDRVSYYTKVSYGIVLHCKHSIRGLNSSLKWSIARLVIFVLSVCVLS